jgi:S-adenosylmethionine hydrolase
VHRILAKGTVHLIGVDMESNKDQHIVMQWNDHYFIAADNGILACCRKKNCATKIVAITIHDRLHK